MKAKETRQNIANGSATFYRQFSQLVAANRLLLKLCVILVLCICTPYYQVLTSSASEQGSQMLLAYYAYWKSDYRANNIPYGKLTHISHAFILPRADGSLLVPEGPPPYLEPDLVTNAHAAGVKVLASIGGYGGSENFPIVASNPTLRATFADNIESFLRAYGYDGVDIDWEFPQNAADRTNQNLLIKAIRDKFNSSPQPAPSWLISMAVVSSNWYGQWNDYDILNEYVDFYNLMTYDFHGSWSGHSGHNAPLYRGSDPDTEQNVKAALDYMIDTRAVPPEKINMGIPFYGRNFVTTEELYDSCSGGCSTIDYGYGEIVPSIGHGWTYHWDAASQVPYLTNDVGTGVLTYDDPVSVKLKVAYGLRTRHVAGVFMWELSADYISGTGQPLMNAMYDAYTKGHSVFLPLVLK